MDADRKERLKNSKTFEDNKILSALEIKNKKTILKSMPLRLRVPLTSRCNIRCIMCSYYENKWDLPERIVREVIEFMPYLENIQWYGGEVFLFRHFERLFDEASMYPRLNQRLDTNGLLLNEKWIRKLAANGTGLDISIDGLTKETYEYVRCGGKFKKLISNLEKLRDYRVKNEDSCSRNMDVAMSFIVMRSNYEEIDKIVGFAKEYKINRIQLNHLYHIKGNRAVYEMESAICDRKISKYLTERIPVITKKAAPYGIEIVDRVTVKPWVKKHMKKKYMLSGVVPCNMPWGQLCINPDCSVTPNCYCTTAAGDIMKNTLREIWNNRIMQEYRRILITGKFLPSCSDVCIQGLVKDIVI